MKTAIGEGTLDLPQDLLDLIAYCADRIDADRALPQSLLDRLHSVGACRRLLPRAVGGLEEPLPEYLQWIQRLAQADASTAWCVNQAGVIGTTSLWLSLPTAQQIWSDSQQSVANGPPMGATLEPTAEGGVITGKWGFSSGCRHARLMTAAARNTGDQSWYMAFFLPSQVQFTDDWQTSGLRGTASFRFEAKALSVPRDMLANLARKPCVDTRLTRLPTTLIFAVTFAAVALGVARRGLDLTCELVQGKHPIFAREPLRDDPTTHQQLGLLEARWRSAAAWLQYEVEKVWEAIAHQEAMVIDQRMAWRLAGTHVIREAVGVMQGAYTIAGSSVIYRGHPLHRPWADLEVISQHVQARMQYYAMAGRYLAGHSWEFGPMS